jgi:hypothetical protein
VIRSVFDHLRRRKAFPKTESAIDSFALGPGSALCPASPESRDAGNDLFAKSQQPPAGPLLCLTSIFTPPRGLPELRGETTPPHSAHSQATVLEPLFRYAQ